MTGHTERYGEKLRKWIKVGASPCGGISNNRVIDELAKLAAVA